jgi:hypothetical protein
MTKLVVASTLGLAAVVGLATPSEAGARVNFYVGAPVVVPGYYEPYPFDEPVFVQRRPRYYYYEPDPREYSAYDEFDEEPYYEPEYDPRYPRRADRFEQYDYDRQFLAPELQRAPVEERVVPRKPVKKAEQKKPEKKKKVSTLSCSRATKVVSEYGFSDITSVDCKGQVYAFNGVRDGKKFSIKLNSVNGELTEVKKL